MDSTSYGKAVDVNPIETVLRTSIGSFSWSAYFAYAVGMMTGISPTGEIPRHSFHEEYPTWHSIKEDANLSPSAFAIFKGAVSCLRCSHYHIFADSATIPPEEWAPIDALLLYPFCLLHGINSERTKVRLWRIGAAYPRVTFLSHGRWKTKKGFAFILKLRSA